MAKNTVASLAARMDNIEGTLNLILAKIEGDTPAKTVTRKRPATKKPATKRPAAKAPAKAPAVRALCKATRQDFVAAAPWAKGLSTQTIAAMCVEDPSIVPAGFRIGERYTAMFTA